MQGSEFDALVEDIRANGLIEPIWIYQDQIIDGRNRFRACEAAKVKPAFRTWEKDGNGSLFSFVISLNLKRRHLDESQRAMVAAKLATMQRGRPTENASIEAFSQPDAAKMLNVARASVQRAREVLEHGTPELISSVERGEIPVSRAVTEIKRGRIKDDLESVASQETKALSGLFDVIVVDPPWPMEKIEREERPNQAEFDYPVMDLLEIEDYVGQQIKTHAFAACHFFVWTTHKFLPATFRLLEAWNIKYICTMVWHKPGGFQPFGLPQYNCEFVLYARQGSAQFTDTKAFPVCFEAPRAQHSAKPEEFYAIIRRVTAGRRLDMFSRRAIDGFEGWGKEA